MPVRETPIVVPTPTPRREPTSRSYTYGALSQTHDDFDPRLIQTIEDLYEGGFEIMKKASGYICPLDGESAARYAERCRITSYEAFFSQIVDQFVSDVFVQPLSIKPAPDANNPSTPGETPDKDFYAEFEKNADRRGTSFVEVMGEALRTALKQQRALVIVDGPNVDASAPAPMSRADEDATGARRFYAYHCPITRLIDWKIDEESGRYLWAVLYDRDNDREVPGGSRNIVHETFTVWMSAGEGSQARAHWERWGIRYDQTEKRKPEKDDALTLEDEGDTSFREIPILKLELSNGLWVGNKVGPGAYEHWNRRSALVGAENKSMVEIPYIAQGPQANAVGGAIPADVSQDQSRGDNPVGLFNRKGWLKLAAGDSAGYMSPNGHCYQIIHEQLKELKEAQFQVTFQMAASLPRNSTSMGRSGLSKMKDQDLTARVLRALGLKVRNFGVAVFDCISEARGEDVHWTPHGLDAYDSESREDLIEEAYNLDQIAEAIPSETFHKAYARAVAETLLKGKVDVQTMAQILTELDAGIEAKHAINELALEAKKDALENPAPPPVPSPPNGTPPNAKRPTAKGPPQPGSKQAA